MAEIRFLPVCSSCRTILDDQEIDYRPCIGEIEHAPNTVRSALEHEIIPNRCPKCGEHFDSFDGWIRITEEKPVQEGWHKVLYGDWSEAIGDEENTFYEGIELFLNGEWLNEPDEFLIYYKPEVLRKYKEDA